MKKLLSILAVSVCLPALAQQSIYSSDVLRPRSVTYKTPYDFGALGGAADDTAALFNCFSSGRCLIPGVFNSNSALTIPSGGAVVCTGANSGVNFTNPGAAGIQIGSMVFGGTSATNPYTTGQILRDCTITGTATVGVLVKHATRVDIHNVRSSPIGIWGFDLADTFGSSFTKLDTRESSNPSAGSFTGGCFRFRDGYNANYAGNLYTSNTNEPYAFYIGESGEANAPGGIVGNVLDAPTAQGVLTGLYLGKGIIGLTVGSYYTEQVKTALQSGTVNAVDRPHGVTFNGGYFAGIRLPIYGGVYLGEAAIDLYQAIGMTFNDASIQVRPLTDNPITVIGDGTGAVVYGLVKPDLTFGSLVVGNAGEGYTACSLAMPGGATGTCTATGGKISVSLIGAGSGLVRTSALAVRYFSVRAVTFNNPQIVYGGPMWPQIVRANGATSRGGIRINNDVSVTQPLSVAGSGGNADVIKSDDNTSKHFVVRRDDNGVEQVQAFVPPVYP